MNKTIIFAHRGVSEFAPENTIPALEMAIDINCPGIEFDVHLSKDGIPVIIHDETLDRTSTGTGYVKDLNLKELQVFDYGIKFSQKFQGATIPTLEEFLTLAQKKKYRGYINVELKNDVVDYPKIEEKILNLLELYEFSAQSLISSFNHKSIAHIREISSTIKVSLLYDEKIAPSPNDLTSFKNLASVNAYSANIHFRDFSEALFESLSKRNFQILCYTINSKVDLEKFIDYGVNGIFTNNPKLALEIIKNRET